MRSNRVVVVAVAVAALVAGIVGTLELASNNRTSSGSASQASSAPAQAALGLVPQRAAGVPRSGGSTSTGSGAGGAPAEVGQAVAAAAPEVIRTGQVSLLVARGCLVSVFDTVSSDAAGLGGFVADSSSASLSQQLPQGDVVVRVPAANFTPLVAEIDRLGKVESQQLQGRDVAGQVVDIAARITNLQAEQLSLRTLLSRAGSIPAILQVQNELFGVEQEIEQLSAQQSSLANQTTYASLTVALGVVPPPVPARPQGQNAVVRAAKLAWHNAAVAGRSLVLALGWAFPALVVAAGALLAVWIRRRRSTGSAAPTAPAAP